MAAGISDDEITSTMDFMGRRQPLASPRLSPVTGTGGGVTGSPVTAPGPLGGRGASAALLRLGTAVEQGPEATEALIREVSRGVGGGESAGPSDTGPGTGVGSITGMDPAAFGSFLSFAGGAIPFGGLPGTAFGFANMAGLGPKADLTVQTAQGPQAAIPAGRMGDPSHGVFGIVGSFLASILGIPGQIVGPVGRAIALGLQGSPQHFTLDPETAAVLGPVNTQQLLDLLHDPVMHEFILNSLVPVIAASPNMSLTFQGEGQTSTGGKGYGDFGVRGVDTSGQGGLGSTGGAVPGAPGQPGTSAAPPGQDPNNDDPTGEAGGGVAGPSTGD